MLTTVLYSTAHSPLYFGIYTQMERSYRLYHELHRVDLNLKYKNERNVTALCNFLNLIKLMLLGAIY